MKRTFKLTIAILFILCAISFAQSQTQPNKEADNPSNIAPDNPGAEKKLPVEFYIVHEKEKMLKFADEMKETRFRHFMTFTIFDVTQDKEAEKRVKSIIDKFPQVDIICSINGKVLAGSFDITRYFEHLVLHVLRPNDIKHPLEKEPVVDDTDSDMETKINWLLGMLGVIVLAYIRKLPKTVQLALLSIINFGKAVSEVNKINKPKENQNDDKSKIES